MMNNYVLINPMGTDNGKPFSLLSEALSYLYTTIVHQKIHMDATLVSMEATKDAFVVTIETYNYFRGRSIKEIGIKVASEDDANKIKKYFEINF